MKFADSVKLKPGFHYRQLGPLTRAVNSGSGNRALVTKTDQLSFKA